MDKIDVKAVRAALEMTQTQLAAELGVAQGDVSNWERGRHQPSGAARRAIENLLKDRREQVA